MQYIYIYIYIYKIVVLASEPVGGRSRVTELPCFLGEWSGGGVEGEWGGAEGSGGGGEGSGGGVGGGEWRGSGGSKGEGGVQNLDLK